MSVAVLAIPYQPRCLHHCLHTHPPTHPLHRPGSILPTSSATNTYVPAPDCSDDPTGLSLLSVGDSSTAAAVNAAAAEAQARGCAEGQPRFVPLPALESLAVHLRGTYVHVVAAGCGLLCCQWYVCARCARTGSLNAGPVQYSGLQSKRVTLPHTLSCPCMLVCLRCVCVCAHVVSAAANRHAAETETPQALPLGGLLSHLSGLTGLTQLHISSKLKYTEGEGGGFFSPAASPRVG